MPTEKPKVKIFDPEADIAGKFGYYIKIVVSVLVVAVLTMIFMVAGLLLDSFHFNSMAYREYSDKVETLESAQKSNAILLESNKKNQQTIIDQQMHIQELLNKK